VSQSRTVLQLPYINIHRTNTTPLREINQWRIHNIVKYKIIFLISVLPPLSVIDTMNFYIVYVTTKLFQHSYNVESINSINQLIKLIA